MRMPKPVQTKYGKWRVQICINGQRYSINRDTENECILAAAELMSGKNTPSSRLTLTQAIDRYIEDRSQVLSPSTLQGYRVIQRNRFKPMMPKIISSVTDKQWQSAVNAEARIVSPKTLKNSWMFVCSVLSYNGIQPPRCKLPQIVKDDRPFLDPEQIQTFLEAVNGERVEIPSLLALHGLRRSEIFALTWDDIDLERGIITVAGAYVQDENGHYVLKAENKTVSSRRLVPILIPRLTELLSDRKGAAKVIPMSIDSIYTAINRVCESAGLPLVGVHGLRHSFASLCYHLDIPEKAVMQIGGWSNDSTMRKIYTHLARQDFDSSISDIKSFFSDENKPE